MSPINTWAGCTLKSRKPKSAPATAAVTGSMPPPSAREAIVKKTATTAVTLEARPSRPSVKLTPLSRTQNREIGQRNRDPFDIQHIVRERKDHRQTAFILKNQINHKNSGHCQLTEQLLFGKKSVGTLQHHFQIVIQKTDDSKAQGQKQNRNDLGITAHKKQAGHQDADKNDAFHPLWGFPLSSDGTERPRLSLSVRPCSLRRKGMTKGLNATLIANATSSGIITD